MTRLVTLMLLVAVVPMAGDAAAAQSPIDWSRAPHVAVHMGKMRFTPATITLAAGRPVVLDIIGDRGSHDFSASQFFAAATMMPVDRAAVAAGTVALESGEHQSVRLIPAAGRYPLWCSRPFHAIRGMRGTIDVR